MKQVRDVSVNLQTLILASEGNNIATYDAREVVYSQGDPADSVFYIQDGKAKVSVLSVDGKEAIVGLPEAGDFFGERCLDGQKTRRATASAMTECVIVRLPRSEILRVIREKPSFAEFFISHLLSRNARVEEDLLDHLFNSSEQRLARVLLLLAKMDEESRSKPILVKVSQEMLAEMIGTTRSRVSFFMNKFRDLGYIDYNGHIKVHSILSRVITNGKTQGRGMPVQVDSQSSLLVSRGDARANARDHERASSVRLSAPHDRVTGVRTMRT